MSLIEALREASTDSLDAYKCFVVDAAAGVVDPDPETALEVCRAANRSPAQMASDIETASRRHEARQAYLSRDFGVEIEQATIEYRSMPALVEQAKAELEAAQEKLRSLTQRQSQLLTIRSTLERDKKTAHDAYTKLMQATSQEVRDPAKPTNFRLS